MDYEREKMNIKKRLENELNRLEQDYNKKVIAARLQYERRLSELKRKKIMMNEEVLSFQEFCDLT